MSPTPKAKIYSPTPTEKKNFYKVLEKCTVPTDVFDSYRRKAVLWFCKFQKSPTLIGNADRCTTPKTAEVKTSKLFKQSYLVAAVDDAWLGVAAPGTNAIAVSMQPRTLPPLVLVPFRKWRQRESFHLSILEHEFVHVNQILLGRYLPDEPSINHIQLMEEFVQSVRMEYEANILQLTRWPQLFPQKWGLSLDHWCALRGYTQPLERLLMTIWTKNVDHGEAIRFIQSIPETLPATFHRSGIDHTHVAWFKKHWFHHLTIALTTVIKTCPEGKSNEAIRAITGYWKILKSRPASLESH